MFQQREQTVPKNPSRQSESMPTGLNLGIPYLAGCFSYLATWAFAGKKAIWVFLVMQGKVSACV